MQLRLKAQDQGQNEKAARGGGGREEGKREKKRKRGIWSCFGSALLGNCTEVWMCFSSCAGNTL